LAHDIDKRGGKGALPTSTALPTKVRGSIISRMQYLAFAGGLEMGNPARVWGYRARAQPRAVAESTPA